MSSNNKSDKNIKNRVDSYFLSKELKRLQHGVKTTFIATFTTNISLLLNIISITVAIFNDDPKVKQTCFGLVISFLAIIIIIDGICLYLSKRKRIVTLNKDDACKQFDEYILPNVFCSLEYSKEMELIDSTSNEYKLLQIEARYHLKCALGELTNMATTNSKVFNNDNIKVDRFNTIKDLIEEIYNKIGDNGNELKKFIDVLKTVNL